MWIIGFGTTEREQEYDTSEKSPKNANRSVGARVRLMVKGCCLTVRASKGIEIR